MATSLNSGSFLENISMVGNVPIFGQRKIEKNSNASLLQYFHNICHHSSVLHHLVTEVHAGLKESGKITI